MEKNYEVEDELEIDLKELIFELLNNWVVIVASAFMVAAIFFCISKFIMVPKYESTSELYVLSKSTSITSLADIQMGTSLTNDYLVVVKGRPVLEQVISNLDLDETFQSLSGKVTLNNPTNSRVLEITVEDEDPIVAKSIADEIAEVSSAFIAEKMDQDPPTIIQYGYADGKPVGPNTVRNTLLGGLIGGFIAAAVVAIGYLLNDTIVSTEDIEKKLRLNVLGTLPLEEGEYDGGSKSKTKKKAVKSA